MVIWLETELHSNVVSADTIAKEEWLNFNSFTFLKWISVWVKLSREYYSSTIEYNFTPFQNSLETFKEIKTFLEWQIKKYNLYKHSNWPSYVWTHIHIFDVDRINMKIEPLLKWVSWFIINNISSIDKKWIQRLLFAHQLWGNYSWKNNHIWRNFLNDKWKCPDIYNNTKDKPKYNPIIYSIVNQETGKPKSLEIRLIPNEFVFDLKIFELIKLIKNKKYSKNKKDINSLYEVLYNILYQNTSTINTANNTAVINDDFVITDFLSTTNRHQSVFYFNNNEYNKNKIEKIINYYNNTNDIIRIIETEWIKDTNYVWFNEILLIAIETFQLNNFIVNKIIDDIENYFTS